MSLPSPFYSAIHTIVVSDLHLADAEPPHPKKPLWKRFKGKDLFIDGTFKLFLEKIQKIVPGPIELIFNGDVFDFDSVMTLPAKPEFSISWLERRRGLAPEEAKSRFKIQVILDAHSTWLESVREFILNGNRVVFNIGNHDMELHWPSVCRDLQNRMNLPEQFQDSVRFTEWFYISNQDTLIEHGNQYDAYCLCSNPIHPLIKKRGKVLMRLPFGNLAGKYMLNGMGLMNPHVDSSFIKDSVFEYMIFFMRYVIRTQPLLLFAWFWSAIATLIVSLQEGFHRALNDPLTVDTRVEGIAQRANSTVPVVWALKEVHAHPAIFSPLKILRELWLDRAILFSLVIFISFEIFATVNVFANISIAWIVIPFLILLPMFIFYARSVESEVSKLQKVAFAMIPFSARIAKVSRVIQGHTHQEIHTQIKGIEYFNTGTWSPAFHDIECTKAYGRKCFAWIKPDLNNPRNRICSLYEWTGTDIVLIPINETDQFYATNSSH
ncbi:MAG: metallophosphoesterase [Bacteriovorax sp.]|nr:metallophosphoesterase [Bacteriovorax sp.]